MKKRDNNQPVDAVRPPETIEFDGGLGRHCAILRLLRLEEAEDLVEEDWCEALRRLDEARA